jgi:SecD/SecF fusion protein
MSEVLTRSLATSFCTLLPVVALLFFGGETLKDFAFALMVGVASGAYSSVFIASPVLTHWKEREGSYRNRRARIVRELGAVPAYATAAGGVPEDVEPAKQRKRSVSIFGADGPPDAGAGEQLSRDEFQELVRDLDVDQPARPAPGAGAGVAQKPRKARRAAQQPPPEPEQPAAPERDPAADLTPEDLVMKEDKPAPKRKRQRNRKHGRR